MMLPGSLSMIYSYGSTLTPQQMSCLSCVPLFRLVGWVVINMSLRTVIVILCNYQQAWLRWWCITKNMLKRSSLIRILKLPFLIIGNSLTVGGLRSTSMRILVLDAEEDWGLFAVMIKVVFFWLGLIFVRLIGMLKPRRLWLLDTGGKLLRGWASKRFIWKVMLSNVISAIINREVARALIHLIYVSLISLLHSFDEVIASFVRRGGNIVAHMVARWETDFAHEKVCMPPFPACLRSLAELDLS